MNGLIAVIKRVFRGNCVTFYLICPFYHVRTWHSLPRGHGKKKKKNATLEADSSPHQKMQPVDVLILDFSNLTELWEIQFQCL